MYISWDHGDVKRDYTRKEHGAILYNLSTAPYRTHCNTLPCRYFLQVLDMLKSAEKENKTKFLCPPLHSYNNCEDGVLPSFGMSLEAPALIAHRLECNSNFCPG